MLFFMYFGPVALKLNKSVLVLNIFSLYHILPQRFTHFATLASRR